MHAPPLATAAAVAAILAFSAAPAAAECPGGAPACPYASASEIGQRSGGVLRFPQAVAIGRDGLVYVGDQGSHVVQVFAPDGRFVREIGSPGTDPGQLTSVGALAAADDGSLLVADGRNKIMRFGAAGELLGSFGSSGDDVGEFRFGSGRGNDAGAGGGLAVSGNTLFVADSGNDRIQRLMLDGRGGTVIVPSGVLANPKGIAVRGTRMLVADDQNHRVLAFDTGGRQLRAVGAGNGTRPGQLNFPYGVAIDPRGRVFVADNNNHRVVRFSAAPRYPYKGRWGAYGTGPGRLAYPRGLATDAAGNVYVANTGNDRVDVFDRGGHLLRSFGSSGRGTGQFNAPVGVAADASGMRAVTDSVNGRVEFLAPDGSVATVWGSPAPGPTILPRPVAVAFDAGGNAYVLDQRRARIVVFDRGTGLPKRTIASQGRGPGRLLDPSGLAISPGGTIYVADTGNSRVARFSLDGAYLGAWTGTGRVRGVAVSPDGSRIYTTGSGNRITMYGTDGAELDEWGGTGRKLGKLSAPAGIAVDAAGNLWVADRGNNRVQQFGPAGERLQMFGERGSGLGQFIHPTDVAVDCRGTVTVTDNDNNRVQQFAGAAPGAACAELPTLGTPPAPKLPTLPAPDGPQVTLKAAKRAGVLRGRTLPLRAGCDTACKMTVTVKLTPRGRSTGRRGKRRPVSITTRRLTVDLPAGETRIVRPRLSSRQARGLRKALRGRRGLAATVQATATAAVGAPTSVTQSLNVTA